MRTKVFKKAAAVTLSAAMVITMAGCGSDDNSKKDDSKKTEDVGATIDAIKLGEDHKDIKADLKFLTNRTDLIDTTFKDYIAEFQKDYPNVNIEYEGITDYANDVTTRLSTGDWGEICMIPPSVAKDEVKNYFCSFGKKDKLGEIYDENLLTDFVLDNEVYGIPSMANLQGIVYNKKVFEQAGIESLPKTPDEFLDDLKKIKDNTKAIPLYTNFAADWTMGAWDAYIDGGATGDPDFKNKGMARGKDPFSDRGDGTGPYAVYNTLYEAVSRGLTEEDPTTTDWEGSKPMINEGKIGCMVLGSWALIQMQQAGKNKDDVAYMPFPITVNQKQYASEGTDYKYGINVNATQDQKIAAMCYIKYLVEKSGYATNEGGLSIVKGDPFPEAFTSFQDVQLVVNYPAPEGDESLFDDINNESELGLNNTGYIPKEVLQAAVSKDKTMEDMVKEWNEKWSTAQKNKGVEVK